MNKSVGIYDSVENVLAKLCVLRNSCVSKLHTNKSDPDSMWLKGAEAMLKEAVDELQSELQA